MLGCNTRGIVSALSILNLTGIIRSRMALDACCFNTPGLTALYVHELTISNNQLLTFLIIIILRYKVYLNCSNRWRSRKTCKKLLHQAKQLGENNSKIKLIYSHSEVIFIENTNINFNYLFSQWHKKDGSIIFYRYHIYKKIYMET